MIVLMHMLYWSLTPCFLCGDLYTIW